MMLRWVLGVLTALMLIVAPAAAQKPLSRAEFRDAVIAVVRAEAPDAEIEVTGELSFHVTREDPAGGDDDVDLTTNLDRGYEEHTWDPSTLDEVASRWARFATGPLEDNRMPERLVGIMRTQAHVVGFQEFMANAEEPGVLVWRPIAGDVVEMMVFDSAESVQFTTEDALAELNVTPERAWAMTVENLPARLGAIESEALAEGVELFSGGNGLAPSILLNPTLCAGEGNEWFSYLLVDRDAYVRGDRRVRGDVQIRAIRDGLVRDGDAFSATILVCAGGRLVEETF
jgi:hypothetical protein